MYKAINCFASVIDSLHYNMRRRNLLHHESVSLYLMGEDNDDCEAGGKEESCCLDGEVEVGIF